MGIYGNSIKLSNETPSQSLSEQEILEIFSSMIMESYIDSLDDEDEDEFIEEGVNIDALKAFYTFKKDIKKKTKELKKNIKSKNKADAKKNIKELKDIISKAEKEIDKLDWDSGVSSILAFFAYFVQYLGSMLAVPFALVKPVNFVAKITGSPVGAGMIGSFIADIWVLARSIKEMIDASRASSAFSKSKGSYAKKSNMIRAKIIMYFEKVKDSYTKLEKEIDKIEEEKKDK